MFFAAPQPGPPARLAVSLAKACNWKSEPSERPRALTPPMRRRSRRVIFICGSHRSVLMPPGSFIISFLRLIYRSMVEKEFRTVNQGPSQILHDGQPGIFALFAAGLGVFTQLHQVGVEADGLFRIGHSLVQLR